MSQKLLPGQYDPFTRKVIGSRSQFDLAGGPSHWWPRLPEAEEQGDDDHSKDQTRRSA